MNDEEPESPPDLYIQRPRSETCGSCKWYAANPIDASPGPGKGRCRRHAPALGYPLVYHMNWCGDHTEKP